MFVLPSTPLPVNRLSELGLLHLRFENSQHNSFLQKKSVLMPRWAPVFNVHQFELVFEKHRAFFVFTSAQKLKEAFDYGWSRLLSRVPTHDTRF